MANRRLDGFVPKRDPYADVSARIIAELEAGAAPWIKPWSATPGMNTPCNAVTNRPYSGCNVILLWMAQSAGYRTPRYLTFKQAQELGGHVRKGEHGTPVYFVKQLQVRDQRTEEDEATRVVPMMREYTVFNVDQCDGLPDRVLTFGETKRRNPDERDATIDEFLACNGADIREGSGEAYYRPGADFISLPHFKAFKSAAHFYGVAFHELGHWTGHKSRLDRDLRSRFGERAYAAEELVARQRPLDGGDDARQNKPSPDRGRDQPAWRGPARCVCPYAARDLQGANAVLPLRRLHPSIARWENAEFRGNRRPSFGACARTDHAGRDIQPGSGRYGFRCRCA
jgi:antirestriction protein ArdC